MSDDQQPSIWPRVQLSADCAAKLAPSGRVKLEQLQAGELVTIWLEPDQVLALIDGYLHHTAARN